MNKLKLIQEAGILADHAGTALIVMEAMWSKDWIALDDFDDGNTNKNALTVYKELEKVGLVKYQANNSINFDLTDKGINLLSKMTGTPKVNTNPDEWISEYRALWISPITGKFYTDPEGRGMGATLREVTARMNSFLDNYREIFVGLPQDVTPQQVIIEATKNYVDNAKKRGFHFSKDCFNFIFKQEGKTKDTTKSLLAANCENYINGYGKEKPKSTFGKSIN